MASRAERWLEKEDQTQFEARVARLAWLEEHAPKAKYWVINGGWLGNQLFEEARYCFTYGQFLAATALGFAFIERTLAAIFFATGRNDLQRATSEKIIEEALKAGWISAGQSEELTRLRGVRNVLAHFRPPLHEDGHDVRAVVRRETPHAISEADARAVLEVLFRLVERNAVK